MFPVPHFRELGLESLKVPGLDLQQCGLQVWCWLVSTVGWFTLCVCGAVARLCVRGYETEGWFLCCVVWVGYWRHEPVVCSHVVASFLSDSCFATGCGLCVVTRWLGFYPLSPATLCGWVAGEACSLGVTVIGRTSGAVLVLLSLLSSEICANCSSQVLASFVWLAKALW
ncbi:hypothetical protein Taro_036749 [Colocasia esculenta]|uniref:Uncharacterized protein n=1 Tax=Colocasia esculenta TaxID=4460 RepID=A0A843WML0_COLES|nr:hypothetical protein [Colocasia esculenta]